MIDYTQILHINYVGKKWSMLDNKYEHLNWMDESTKPTQNELDALWPATEERLKKTDCKTKAQQLLQATDWVTLSDITTGTHRLTNQADFLAYRDSLRGLVINPVANPTWPTLPTEQWN